MGKHDNKQTTEIAELLLAGMPPAVVIDTLRVPRELVYDIRRAIGGGAYTHKPNRNRKLRKRK